MCSECGWEDALDRACDLRDRAEELPERAEDFSSSVWDVLNDIAIWIEDNEHVTDAQKVALDNIAGGIAKWER